MKYDHVQRLNEEDFRRLTGVQRCTFEQMVDLLGKAESARRSQQNWRGGRRPRLSLEDKLLLTLEYLREYRTQFHIAQSYGVSEATVNLTIRRVEDVLIKSGAFSLPGKKALLKSDVEWTIAMVDATETPVERPKKSRSASTPAKRSGTR